MYHPSHKQQNAQTSAYVIIPSCQRSTCATGEYIIYACFVIGKINPLDILSIKTLGPQGSLAIDQSTIILERKRRAEAEVLHNSEYT